MTAVYQNSTSAYHSPTCMLPLTRRAFLALTSLFAPFAHLRLAGQSTPATVSVEDFVRLSQRLTARPSVDRETAAIYLNALLAVPGDATELAQMVRSQSAATTPAQIALERTIIEWWYTGIYKVKGEPRLATHTGALMWSAMAMPAAGTCRAGFGGWARAPQPRA